MRRLTFIFILFLVSMTIDAQHSINADGIDISYSIPAEKNGIYVSGVYNNRGNDVYIKLPGSGPIMVPAKSRAPVNAICRYIQVSMDGKDFGTLLPQSRVKELVNAAEASTSKPEAEKPAPTDEKPSEKSKPTEAKTTPKPADNEATTRRQVDEPAKPVAAMEIDIDVDRDVVRQNSKGASAATVISDFKAFLDRIPFYSEQNINQETDKVNQHLQNLRNWKDRDEYITNNQLMTLIQQLRDSVNFHKGQAGFVVRDFLTDNYKRQGIADRDECLDSLTKIIEDRLKAHDRNAALIEEEINSKEVEDSDIYWKPILIIVAALLLLGALVAWYLRHRKEQEMPARVSSPDRRPTPTPEEARQSIVVRRKTTTILRKQSIDDVVNNPAYMRIDTADFCSDSAVRLMYLKNTCVKDIYNMYAEDLRDESNPKEDGCMVLGRWFYDEKAREYYVTLEQIVKPGDDAIFGEYELNFGGKIKLRVNQLLRKLRTTTGLQYDLTCWVHSHPGLGVFFSNSDSTVQMQLKHPTHPHFLTALVIDILTPEQTTGVFIFRKDGTINSKDDIHRMYSLEEWYRWAVESDRNTIDTENTYNLLAKAVRHTEKCNGIHMTNSAIIDIDMLLSEQRSGLVGFVHGFGREQGASSSLEFLINKVAKETAVPDNDLVGCLVVTSHFSMPSVRKAIMGYEQKIGFVLVYSTAEGKLTAIPADERGLTTDYQYYGEQQFDDLKIWTRRRR